MNKARRKAMWALCAEIESIKDRIDAIITDEEDYFDNMPENLQYSQKAEMSEDAVDNMYDCTSDLETAYEALDNACKSLDIATA